MSIKKKSDENFQAIDLLLQENLFSPVIHCSYYSCLQLIIHFVYEYCEVTEEQILEETKDKGSHNFYLNKYVSEIKRINSRNAVLFYQYISKFKRKRTESDYQLEEVAKEDSIKAKETAKKIRKFIELIDNEGRCENIHNL